MEKEPVYTIGKDKDYFEEGKDAYFIKNKSGKRHFKDIESFEEELVKISEERIKSENMDKSELEFMKVFGIIFCNNCRLNVIKGERYSSYISEHGSLNAKEKVICDDCDEKGFLSALF